MQTLSQDIEHFLDAVALVSELGARNVALADAARTLCGRLARSADTGSTRDTECIQKRLILVGELRREISKLIARIRLQQGFQLLGDEAMTRGQ